MIGIVARNGLFILTPQGSAASENIGLFSPVREMALAQV
jgi:hypothetical protein